VFFQFTYGNVVEVVLKALLKLRCDIYCCSVRGACYSVMEGS